MDTPVESKGSSTKIVMIASIVLSLAIVASYFVGMEYLDSGNLFGLNDSPSIEEVGVEVPTPASNMEYIRALQSELVDLRFTQSTQISAINTTLNDVVIGLGALADGQEALRHGQKGLSKDDLNEVVAAVEKVGMNSVAIQQSIGKTGKRVTTLERKVSPPKRVSPGMLPFTVVDVDYWNGKERATISHGDVETTLVAPNEWRLGWQLIKISVEDKEVTFANKKRQIATVKIG